MFSRVLNETRLLVQPDVWQSTLMDKNHITGRTQRKRGDLCVQIQHPVPISIHQVVSPALLVVTEEINCTHVLWNEETRRETRWGRAFCLVFIYLFSLHLRNSTSHCVFKGLRTSFAINCDFGALCEISPRTAESLLKHLQRQYSSPLECSGGHFGGQWNQTGIFRNQWIQIDFMAEWQHRAQGLGGMSCDERFDLLLKHKTD